VSDEQQNSAVSSSAVCQTQVEMTQLVLPQYANSLGNVFGGQIVCWIDICAAVAAQRHCRSQVVTASIDAVHFIAPVKLGHILVLRGQVNAAFRSSMECGVSVWMEDPCSGMRAKAAKAYATFVALDEAGNPQNVPPLEALSDDDKRRAQEATMRRNARLELRKAMGKTVDDQ
jgi:acyl-CoA hydrolase